MRDLVTNFQRILDAQGFALISRGSSHSANWVRFSRPAQNAISQDGTLMLLLAHSSGERALLADAYFEDTALRIPIPHSKLLQRYDGESTLPPLMHEFIASVSGWAASSPRGGAAWRV